MLVLGSELIGWRNASLRDVHWMATGALLCSAICVPGASISGKRPVATSRHGLNGEATTGTRFFAAFSGDHILLHCYAATKRTRSDRSFPLLA